MKVRDQDHKMQHGTKGHGAHQPSWLSPKPAKTKLHGDDMKRFGRQRFKYGTPKIGKNLEEIPSGRTHRLTRSLKLKGVDQIPQNKTVLKPREVILKDRSMGRLITLQGRNRKCFSAGRTNKKSLISDILGEETKCPLLAHQ